MKMIKRPICIGLFLLTGILCFIISGQVWAEEGYKIISTPAMNKWMSSEEKPLLVFALSPIEFSKEHIPESICLPLELMKNYYKMPEDQNTPIVFYCHGPG
jgi:hypothetical protein